MQCGSHVHDLVDCLAFVSEWKAAHPAAAEVALELEVRLSELIRKMITSPLTDKMFAIMPHEQISPEPAKGSLEEQMRV